MRNILIGAHGTGKTTLCKVVRELNNIAIRDGISRPMKACRNKLNLTPYQEQAIINELTFFYWDYNKDFKDLILTRSPLDCEVYSRVFGWNDLADECEERILKSGILEEEDVRWFYIPIEFSIEDDGVRFTDVEFQKKIDLEMQNIIKKYKINITVLSGSVEERVNIFNNIKK